MEQKKIEANPPIATLERKLKRTYGLGNQRGSKPRQHLGGVGVKG